MRNWAGNVTYRASRLLRPESLDALCEVVAGHDRVKALGSRHSFNDAADTEGVQVSLDLMPRDLQVDLDERTVSIPAGLSHAEVSELLHAHGLAMPNLASLGHISVGGAIQTGTHGSGVRNRALSAEVTTVELVDASGSVRRFGRGDADFPAVVVGLGAFGVVHRVTQRAVPSFDIEQRVYQGVRWDSLLPRLEEVLGCAYSVSLFTRFDSEEVHQVWVKRRPEEPPFDLRDLGGVESEVTLHPLPDVPVDHVTEQLGVVGPSHERLPHFRADFRPGRGDEIQSEYLLDASRGAEAIEAVRAIGTTVAPLLHIGEVRRVAADDAWLSPSGGRDSVAIHFTWKQLPERVASVVPVLEEVLIPLGARPHWGKVSACDHSTLAALYPRLDDFARRVADLDPHGKFDNAFLRRVLGPRRARV